jgi:hypothetical protein
MTPSAVPYTMLSSLVGHQKLEDFKIFDLDFSSINPGLTQSRRTDGARDRCPTPDGHRP